MGVLKLLHKRFCQMEPTWEALRSSQRSRQYLLSCIPFQARWSWNLEAACHLIYAPIPLCEEWFDCSFAAWFLCWADQGLQSTQSTAIPPSCQGTLASESGTQQKCTQWPKYQFFQCSRSKPKLVLALCSTWKRYMEYLICRLKVLLIQSHKFWLCLSRSTECFLASGLYEKFPAYEHKPFLGKSISCRI